MLATRGSAHAYDTAGLMAIDRAILAGGGATDIRREIRAVQWRLERDAGDGHSPRG